MYRIQHMPQKCKQLGLMPDSDWCNHIAVACREPDQGTNLLVGARAQAHAELLQHPLHRPIVLAQHLHAWQYCLIHRKAS